MSVWRLINILVLCCSGHGLRQSKPFESYLIYFSGAVGWLTTTSTIALNFPVLPSVSRDLALVFFWSLLFFTIYFNFLESMSEAYLESTRTSAMLLFVKIVNSWKALTFSQRSSIVDIRLGSKYIFECFQFISKSWGSLPTLVLLALPKIHELVFACTSTT